MTRHRYLYRPPPANHPALLRAVMVRSLAPVPPVVDLRGFCQAIRDQGQEGCCSGFATAAARELVWAKEAGISAVSYLSPAYLYARTRMTEGTFPHDSGATIVDEVSTLTNYGTCPEIDLPYTANPAEAPTPQDDVQAAPFRCGTPQRVGISPSYVESVLAQGQPVVIGMPVYESFEETGADGLIAIPGLNEQCLGGHALLVCGYNHAAARLTLRNSWTAQWGDNGYCYLPYSMIASFFEAWSIPLQ
jgi:C1A family cysteine protease